MEINKETISNKTEIKINSSDIKYATGRRKKSIARVWLKKGTGSYSINEKKLIDYFVKINLQNIVRRPLLLVKKENEFDVKCTVKGGGLTGQAGAIRLGIARALIEVDNANRSSLKAAGFLTRDARKVERKKYGQPGARKRFQFSKR